MENLIGNISKAKIEVHKNFGGEREEAVTALKEKIMAGSQKGS